MRSCTGDDTAAPGMVATVQTFGDLIHWHPHVHAIISEGVFRKDGTFVGVPELDLSTCVARWQKKVFALLVRKGKIDPDVVESMRRWAHSGFNIDDSVRIECGDNAGMQRLTEYIARCPFSLARMMKVTTDGKVIYRTGKSKGLRFPVPCDERLKPGASRNFQIFEPLEFLAEVTQHIPDKGQHQVHYFGYYSNKSRGLRQRSGQVDMQPSAWYADTREWEQDTEFCRKRRKTSRCSYSVCL